MQLLSKRARFCRPAMGARQGVPAVRRADVTVVPQASQCVFFPTDDVGKEAALQRLAQRRESFLDLAAQLWYSLEAVEVLKAEIQAIYPKLAQPLTMTMNASNRACNALALFQCLASHPETQRLFLTSDAPLLLYPILNSYSVGRPFDYLRLTSLGVIGAMLKHKNPEAVRFLLGRMPTVPLCLRIMESGSELSKTVATFIVQKLLLDDDGLHHVCSSADCLQEVALVLCSMVDVTVNKPNIHLLKHVVLCYLRLMDDVRATVVLKNCWPLGLLSDPLLRRLPVEMARILSEDPATSHNLSKVLRKLEMSVDELV